jgi:hypothetical protein
LFILFGILLAVTVLEELLFVGILKMQGSPSGMNLLVGLIVGIVTAMCGNGWYLSHAQRVIAEVRPEGLEEDAHLKTLARRGGTSLGAAVGLILLLMVLQFAVVFTLAVVFRQV